MESESPRGEALIYVPSAAAYFTCLGMKQLTLLPQQEEGRLSPQPQPSQRETPGGSEGRGSQACCHSWGHNKSMTE